MPRALSQTQIDRYRDVGFLGGIPVLTPAEVATLRAELEAYEKTQGKPLDFPERAEPYLLFNWANTLVHHPRVLDAVEDAIGPDILVYHTTVWIKEPNTDARVFWHQDDAYFHLDPPEQVAAWVALSEAGEREGCMRMLPASHRDGLWAHSDKPVPESLARRGQNIGDDLPDDAGQLVPLRAGEMSFHNTHTVHSSGPTAAPTGGSVLGSAISPPMSVHSPNPFPPRCW